MAHLPPPHPHLPAPSRLSSTSSLSSFPAPPPFASHPSLHHYSSGIGNTRDCAPPPYSSKSHDSNGIDSTRALHSNPHTYAHEHTHSQTHAYQHAPTHGHPHTQPHAHRNQDSNPHGSASDMYRPSPSITSLLQSSSPPALPSMRSIDASLHPPPSHSLGHHQPLPPLPGLLTLPPGPLPFYNMPGPYGMPPPPGLQTYGMHSSSGVPHDRHMSGYGGMHVIRHKKEIKRRTKTGCMTCRKRRIKCDETHPTCNNCKKSKRDCAGYDPIFKQQSSTGTPNSPPESDPASTTTNPPSDASVSTITTTTATAPSGPTEPTPTDVRSASAGCAPPSTYVPAPAATAAAAASAATATYSTAASTTSASTLGPSSLLNTPLATPTSSRPSVYSPTAPTSSASTITPYHAASTSLNPGLDLSRSIVSPQDNSGIVVDLSGTVQRPKMKVEEIIGLSGPPPPPPSTLPTREAIDDMTSIYYEIYVPGLTAFFETSWYNFKPSGGNNPVSILLNNKSIIDLLASFLTAVGAVQSNDPKHPDMVAASNQELRVAWAMASLAYVTPATVNPPGDEPVATDNAAEARSRLSIVDALLSGGSVRTNPCMPPPRTGDPNRIREHQFWWWLAEYLRLQDDANASTTSAAGTASTTSSTTRLREQALTQIRNLLDGRENRDILYSIAVLRELAPQYGMDLATAAPLMIHHTDESDPRNKYTVAAKFLRSESQDHGGTTNVVRRFAQLGYKAYVQPGCNIRRA